MDIKTKVAATLATPVSRKAFLLRTGSAVVAIVGVRAALESLDHTKRAKGPITAFGSGPYGGERPRS